MEFPTYNELLESVNRGLDAAGLTDARNPGTATNLIVGSVIAQVSRAAGFARRVHANSFIQNAVGIYLDIHGEELGVRRREALPAVILADERVLRIRATRGLLRDRLGSSIPADIEATNTEGTVRFTVAATAIPAGVAEIFVSAICQTPGEVGNLGAGQLNTLSINVTDVEVSNIEAITTGVQRETDEQFRSRLLSIVQGGGLATADALIATALSIPGVTFATFLENAFGINHPAILVAGPNKVKAGLAARVEAALIPILPFGARVEVITPTFRAVELVLVVRVTEGAKNNGTKSQIEQIVRQTFFPHRPGTEFFLDAMDAAITRAVPSVLDVEVESVIVDGSRYGTQSIKTEIHEQLVLDTLVIELI